MKASQLLPWAAVCLATCFAGVSRSEDLWVTYQGADGPGKGKHIVLVSGDEEYRSEEGLPQLGKILAREHGFRCTVLFPVNPETRQIDPNYGKNIPGLGALGSADLLIILTRFRDLPDEQMKPIDDYLKSGRPVLGLRTATHAFMTSQPQWAHYSNGYSGEKNPWKDGFGRLVLGERWVSHHGEHKKESTRGLIADAAQGHPIVRGIKNGDIWGDTDVYGVRLPLPDDCQTIVLGQVLTGMSPDDPAVKGPKNEPMMPVGWTKTYEIPGGKQGRAFTTTMGAATDLAREGTRRMVVNAVYWLLGMEEQIPAGGTKVDLVGQYKPTAYGFGGYKKGVKPADHALTDTSDTSASTSPSGGASRLMLRKGDHISIIGNTLADRMQHDGWLEALVHSRFPQQELVFRNLAFSSDEVAVRNRSEGFGEPDAWLAKNKSDVVFAFFGFNESFAGDDGVQKFKTDLQSFIQHSLQQKYNGNSAVRLVLFSPIAHENLKNVNLPDGHENNQRLARYAQAMAEVAHANNVLYVDLFKPSERLYEKAAKPLTINGIHLTEAGNRQLAEVIDQALFGLRPSQLDEGQLQRVRQAVCDKNFYWFNRYRTVDGYSIYGGRSHLKFVNDQTNREVMFREMDVLDVMTANRDRRIWAIAQGGDQKVDDSNTPPFINVITNKPGGGPNGTHLFVGGQESLSKMTVAPGMKVNLYASEEMFPDLINPVQMAFDGKGRLWVAAWQSYPHWKPKEKMNDKLLILEDTDGDGVADVCKTFADGLHNPTGFEFWGGGVLVAMAPDLLYLKDTDGDDKADVRTRILHGLDSADTHHTANSFTLDPGGALYWQEGVFHRTQVETPYGPVRNFDACVWRFEPRTWKFERYVPYGFANPHGHVFDRWGQDIVHDGTGANPFHGTLISGHVPEPAHHRAAPQVYAQRTRPCSGTEILSSRHFPDANQGNLLVANVIGFQGILQYRLEDDGASFVGKEVEPIISSTDPNFRPSDIEIGADGAIYFVDWHNPIIGHMQHNLRDPSRDRTHGRVYRVTYPGRPLLEPAKIAGEPIEHLLDLLKQPEDRVRYRARIELSGRETKAVIDAVQKWVAALDRKDSNYAHNLLEALWVHQHHNVVNAELLRQVVASPDFRARAAATRVLCYWRDRVDGALDLLRTLAADEHPRVRLEAVRAASFFREPEAVEVALISAERPTDKYLDYARSETMKSLEPCWKTLLAAGRDISVKTPAGERFFLRQMPLEQLLGKPRTRPVCVELLDRVGVRDEYRLEAVAALSKLDNKGQLQVLLETINALDAKEVRDSSLVLDLVRLLTTRPAGELSQARRDIERLATAARQDTIRQVALAALVGVDHSPDKAWSLAQRSLSSLQDFLAAVPLISDVSVRAGVYPKIQPLLKGLPNDLASAKAKASGSLGRYVRIELPRVGTLTLAEVEVHSGGKNVARGGKASQVSTANGGQASRAIDGNTSGAFSAGGQTHTVENIKNPWWEVDLGEEYPIDLITIYNRTEEGLGKRLDGFTLRVFDSARREVFVREGNPAPQDKVAFQLESGTPAAVIRRAAMEALTSIRGREVEVFQSLAGFVRDNVDRPAAIRSIRRIGRQHWPADQAAPLLDVLLSYVREIPVEYRTSGTALEAMELADELTSLLPADQAKRQRGELRELGVRVVRVGTLPERMAYDKELIAVSAGKPVEIVFENVDLMPHNLVIVQPGALEEVGLLAESTAQQPGTLERQYVPSSNRVLLSSQLLQSRQTQKLSFKAPAEPGVYPYVCTYPGHWRRMFGALYVVEDLDAYLAGPEAYLASRNLPIKDELLKDNRPRTEWKLDDLAAAVSGLTEGRSFSGGRQMFQVANCAGCHQMNGAGQNFGPDLTKLDPQRSVPLEILRDIVVPSERLNEKYQTEVFTTDGGKTITGLVIEETADKIKVVENPLVKQEAVVLEKSQIDERRKSATSTMPKGLLDKLTRDEILDLVAYIAARGDEKHALFQGVGAHEHKH